MQASTGAWILCSRLERDGVVGLVFFHRLNILTVQEEQETSVVVASHNEESLTYATRRMEEMGTDKDSVFFGQLLGASLCLGSVK